MGIVTVDALDVRRHREVDLGRVVNAGEDVAAVRAELANLTEDVGLGRGSVVAVQTVVLFLSKPLRNRNH